MSDFLSNLSTSALTDGIKFLFDQASELLKRRRDRANTESDETPSMTVAQVTAAGELGPKALAETQADRIAKDATVTQIKVGPGPGEYTAKGRFGSIEGTLTGIDLSERG